MLFACILRRLLQVFKKRMITRAFLFFCCDFAFFLFCNFSVFVLVLAFFWLSLLSQHLIHLLGNLLDSISFPHISSSAYPPTVPLDASSYSLVFVIAAAPSPTSVDASLLRPGILFWHHALALPSPQQRQYFTLVDTKYAI
jgi:hypothetical protein